MRLLSASMDRTMVLWEPDEQSGIWIERVRVGEVGGNQLGFFGCQFGPNSTFILSHGYNGAFHLWKRVSEDSIDDWEPVITVSGHFDEARDVAWDPSGTYIVSVSKDQTSRLFAIWQHDGRWHELARPQVHGFDMSCLAFQPNVRHRIISCSEEKVVRVFDAPKSFVENLARLTGHQASQEELADRAVVANVPALGLSNKPVYESTYNFLLLAMILHQTCQHATCQQKKPLSSMRLRRLFKRLILTSLMMCLETPLIWELIVSDTERDSTSCTRPSRTNSHSAPSGRRIINFMDMETN
jgi:elongator complex protein 2